MMMPYMLGSAGNLSITIMFAIFAIILWGLEFTPSSAIKTYAMEEECGQELSMIFDTIYQGQLVFKPQTNNTGVCLVTIETWYSMPHLMFYFTNLNVSCDDGYIEFVDGRESGESIAGLERRVCGVGEPQTPRAVYLTKSQHLRIKYTRTKQVTQSAVLTIIFTAYSTGTCSNDQYKCSNNRCIHEGVKCNSQNSCGDNSHCRHKLSTVTTAGIVTVSIVGIGILAMIVIMLVYHCYCKKKNQRPNERVLYTNTGNVGHYDDTSRRQEPPTMSIIAGQQPAYPRHWTGNHGYTYNNTPQSQVNVNTNYHYWIVTQGNQTGNSTTRNTASSTNMSHTDSITNTAAQTTTQRDGNWGFNSDSNDELMDERVDKPDDPIDKSIAYYEDEILMDEDDIETNGTTKSQNNTNDGTVNKATGDGATVTSVNDKTVHNTTNESNGLSDKDLNLPPFKYERTDSYSPLRALAANHDGGGNEAETNETEPCSAADEIDKQFEDFYRDLMTDDYNGDDLLNVNESTESESKDQEKEKERLKRETGDVSVNNVHVNHVHSTDT